MNEFNRENLGRKPLEEPDARAATEHRAVSKGVAEGELKGEPRDVDSTGRTKLPARDAAKYAAESDREVGRRDLPLPPEARVDGDDVRRRSLGLRLQVRGDRITVLDSLEVNVPAEVPQKVRGTDFLAVQVGDRILTVQRLIDPGIAVGVPDRHASEFRGHREIALDTYDLTVLLPLEAIEGIADRGSQGTDRAEAPRISVEFVVYRASETTVLEPGRHASLRDHPGLEVVASSGELGLEGLRGTGWADVTRRREARKQSADPNDTGTAE